MATYIGVDGGGTKTRLLIQHDDGAPRYFEFDQTIRFLEHGFEVAAKRLIDLLLGIENLQLDDIQSIAIGLAGAGLEEEQRRFEQAIKSHLHGLVSVTVQSDSTLSLGAAFPDGSGMIVIAGTGSVAVGRKKDGSIVRVGGWGRLLGDEGSGHRIGLDALKHYARAVDGRDAAGTLFHSIEAALANSLMVDPRELRTAIAQNDIAPSEFAKLVFDCADDPAAESILSNSANDLAELILICANQAQHQGDVMGIGSVIQNLDMMRKVGEIIASSGLELSALEAKAPVEHALKLAKSAS